MDKSRKTRRVAVFEADGTVIYDQVDDNTTSSNVNVSPGPTALPPSSAGTAGAPVPMPRHIMSPKAKAGSLSSHAHIIPADRLWKLIKVFAQFSRDVQGGNVRRLIFRSPKSYAPSHNRFEPAPSSSSRRAIPVTVVYLAFSDRYVVAVTERLTGDNASTLNTLLNSPSPVFTVPEFCNGILEFLNRQHEFRDHPSRDPDHDPDNDNRHKDNDHEYTRSNRSSKRTLQLTRSTSNGSTATVLPIPIPKSPSSAARERERKNRVEANNRVQNGHVNDNDEDSSPGLARPQPTTPTTVRTLTSRFSSPNSSSSRISLPVSDQLKSQHPPPLPPTAHTIDYVLLTEYIKNSQNLLGT